MERSRYLLPSNSWRWSAKSKTFWDSTYIWGKALYSNRKGKECIKTDSYKSKVEICAYKNGEWLRIAGELVEDDRREAKQSMLDAYPSLQKMYSADDGNTEVFYFKNATATFYSFTHEKESVNF